MDPRDTTQKCIIINKGSKENVYINQNQNVRQKGSTSESTDYSITKFREYWRSVPRNYDIFYNEESIQLTNDVYGQDVENFGYEYK